MMCMTTTTRVCVCVLDESWRNCLGGKERFIVRALVVIGCASARDQNTHNYILSFGLLRNNLYSLASERRLCVCWSWRLGHKHIQYTYSCKIFGGWPASDNWYFLSARLYTSNAHEIGIFRYIELTGRGKTRATKHKRRIYPWCITIVLGAR